MEKIVIFNFEWLITILNKKKYKHFITNERYWEDFLEYWKPMFIDFKNKQYWRSDIVNEKNFNFKEKEVLKNLELNNI